MERIYRIHEAVSEGRFPNCSSQGERITGAQDAGDFAVDGINETDPGNLHLAFLKVGKVLATPEAGGSGLQKVLERLGEVVLKPGRGDRAFRPAPAYRSAHQVCRNEARVHCQSGVFQSLFREAASDGHLLRQGQRGTDHPLARDEGAVFPQRFPATAETAASS